MSAGRRLPATPTRDLDDPDEIAEMVRRFYQDVAQDELLGPMFEEVAQVDWSEHLPKLTAFWCRALLGISGYQGNPYRAHLETSEKEPFTHAHFERWLGLFHDTVETGWTGPHADQALNFAHRVAQVHANQLVHEPDPADQGGDPACWEGVVHDHRDEPTTVALGPRA